MSREVEHDADGPYVLTTDDIDPVHGDIAVCRCGLSPEFPFCDGSHRVTQDEASDTVYRYPDGPGGERVPVADIWSPGSGEGTTGDGPGSDVVALHEERGPRIVDPADLTEAGGRLELALSDLATEVAETPADDE